MNQNNWQKNEYHSRFCRVKCQDLTPLRSLFGVFFSPVLVNNNSTENQRYQNSCTKQNVNSFHNYSRCRLVSFTNHIIQQIDIFVKYFKVKCPVCQRAGKTYLTPFILPFLFLFFVFATTVFGEEKISKNRDEQSISEMIKILKEEKNSALKQYTIEAIGKTKDKSTVPSLLEQALVENDPAVRIEIVSSLRLIGGDEALSALVTIYEKDNHTGVKMMVLNSLDGFSGDKVDELLKKAAKDKNRNIRRSTIRALGNRRDKSQCSMPLRTRMKMLEWKQLMLLAVQVRKKNLKNF